MRALWIVFVLLGVPLQDADEQYSYVAALAEKGLHDRVVREARTFLEKNPGHAKAELARYRLACALFELRREGEARPVFAELARKDGFEFAAEVQFRLSQCLLAAGDRPAAEAALARVVASGKEYLRAPALALLAQSELARQDHARALEHFEVLLRSGAKSEYATDARCGRAWCLQRLGKLPEAAAAAREALANEPGARAGELSFLLGECLLDQKDARGALAAYRAVREGPFADAAARGSGFALAALGDHRGAAREFGSVLERFPESVHRAECALQQGVELLAAGDAREAAAALARPEVATDPEALAWRARAEVAAGDREAALKTLEQALARKPARELEQRLVLQRADLLAQMGRGAEARKDYERVGSDRALLAAAVQALEAHRHAEAVDLAARMLERFPASALRVDALLALGEGLFGTERWSEAEEAFVAATEGDADEARRTRATSRAAWSAYLGGELARAAERFDAAARGADGLVEVEEAAFMAGRAREDAGDKAGARSAYEAAVKRFPSGPHAPDASLRAALLEERAAPGDPKALARLAELARKLPDGPLGARARFELAERQSVAGLGSEAIANYRVVLQAGAPAELAARARYGLAWSLYQAGQHAESEAALGELLAARDVAPALLESARELAVWNAVQRGNLDAALERWREYLAAGHDDDRAATALHALAGALSKAKRPGDARAAVAAFEGSSRSPKVRPRAALERAMLLADAGQTDEAQRELESARGAGSDDPLIADALFRLGEACFAEGADAKAIPLYDAAARNADTPVAAGALYKAGFARLRSDDAAGAERCFAALLEKHPKSELRNDARFLLGEARFRQRNFDGAIECLERMVKEAPRHASAPKALFRIGIAYGEKERWKDCRDLLTDLVRNQRDFPNLAEAELWRGRALAALADPRGARGAFERVLALDKGQLSAQAHLEVGRLEFDAGDDEAALSEFLKVAMLYAGDEEVAEALVLAGQVLEKQTKLEQARAQYTEAFQKHPKARYAAEAKKRLDELPAR